MEINYKNWAKKWKRCEWHEKGKRYEWQRESKTCEREKIYREFLVGERGI